MPAPRNSLLAPFDPNKSLASQLTAKRLNGILQFLISLTPVKGVGTTFAWTLGGVSINASGGKPSPASAIYPFHVYTRVDPASEDPDSPTYQAGIFSFSDLLTTENPSDTQTITGLLADDPPAADDPGWFTLIPNDLIWLHLEFDPTTAAISHCKIKSYGNGDDDFVPSNSAWTEKAFVEYGSVTATGGVELLFHKFSRVMLAYSIPDDSGNPEMHQRVKTHLMMEARMIAGFPAQFARASVYGAYLSGN